MRETQVIDSQTVSMLQQLDSGMSTHIITCLRVLELENSRLKAMYASERLKVEILKEALERKP